MSFLGVSVGSEKAAQVLVKEALGFLQRHDNMDDGKFHACMEHLELEIYGLLKKEQYSVATEYLVAIYQEAELVIDEDKDLTDFIEGFKHAMSELGYSCSEKGLIEKLMYSLRSQGFKGETVASWVWLGVNSPVRIPIYLKNVFA